MTQCLLTRLNRVYIGGNLIGGLCRSMRTLLFLHGGLVVAFVLASCAPSGADTVVDSADKSATSIPRPTDTPLPASTKSATNTPLPTHTDTPPTAPPTNTPTAAPNDAPTAAPTDAPTAAATNTATPLPANTPTPYEAAVSRWASYEDVGTWLEENFIFDTSRQDVILARNSEQGTLGEGNTLLVRNPSSLFEDKKGYCGDSGYFALDALNKINPAYNARWVLIKNGKGPPDHWVTGFSFRGKLYIMDYGAGHGWSEMMGIHGPYDTLSDYSGFLSSLNLNRFSAALVKWFDPVPVTVD